VQTGPKTMAEPEVGADRNGAIAEVGHEVMMSALSMKLAVSGKSKLMTKDKYDRIVCFFTKSFFIK